MRVSKFTDEQFLKVANSNISDEDKSKKLGISLAYFRLKSKKLGVKKEVVEKPAVDYPVIVTETGTYSRSYITYSTDAVVKAKELREIAECNDTDYVPKAFSVKKMSDKEIEQESFLVNRLKRHFGEPSDNI
jgi:hypothetical protein